MAHVLLHTFVWGTGASDEEKHGFDWADGLDAQEEESLVNAGYYHRPDLVVLQQLKANLRSPLVRDIDGDAILLARNPRFYLDVLGTTKKNFREHFRHGELKDSARAVLRAMLHKMKLLLQITFGYWNKETLSVMEVKRFAVRFDVGGHEHKRAHQDIMEHFGTWHTLMWQFFPLALVLSKIGEAANEPPVFVYDADMHLHMSDIQERLFDWMLNVGKISTTILFVVTQQEWAIWLRMFVSSLWGLKMIMKHPMLRLFERVAIRLGTLIGFSPPPESRRWSKMPTRS
jgi:hypothetical protein